MLKNALMMVIACCWLAGVSYGQQGRTDAPAPGCVNGSHTRPARPEGWARECCPRRCEPLPFGGAGWRPPFPPEELRDFLRRLDERMRYQVCPAPRPAQRP